MSHALGDVRIVLGALALLSAAFARAGEPESAAVLVGAAEALRERTGVALTGAEDELHRETVEAVQRALVARFEGAVADGRALELHEAVEYALDAASVAAQRLPT